MIQYAGGKNPKGEAISLANPTRGHHCWGVFESDWSYYLGDSLVVDVLVIAKEKYQETMEAFLSSEWFKNLTDGKVEHVATGVATEGHLPNLVQKAFQAIKMTYDNTMLIRVDLSGPADRLISGLRLLTWLNKFADVDPSTIKFPLWALPVVDAAIISQGDANADSRITFHAIPASVVDDYCDEEGSNRGEIYDEDFFEWYSEKVTPSLSPEAVGRILTRTKEEFAFLSEQNSPLAKGYCKDDDRVCDKNVTDDEVLTTGAPICDSTQEGEHDSIGYKNVTEHLLKLFSVK